MSFFISDAYAAAEPAAGAAGGDPLTSFLPLILLFVVFYFMLVRPQQKRAKEHRNMVAALQKGDEVVTSGGVLGKIVKAGENFVTIEVAEGVQIRVQRPMVANLMPKGTIKTADQ